MATLSRSVGSLFDYPFPSIESILKESSIEPLKKAILENKKWSISEKLHGCNMALSSQLYVASKKRILANVFEKSDLSETTFQQVSLKHLNKAWKKIENFQTVLKYECQMDMNLCDNDELIIYGEFICNGTATSKYDVYNYKAQKIFPGQFYAFGVGFVFGAGKDLDFYEKKLKQYFTRVQKMTSLTTGETYFVCLINPTNKKYLLHANIDTVVFEKSNLLVDLLTNKRHVSSLENRHLEGYVLHCENFVFKWKYPKGDSGIAYNTLAFFKQNLFMSENESKVLASLQKIVDYGKEYIDKLDQNLLQVFYSKFQDKDEGRFEKRLKLLHDKHELENLNWICSLWTNHALAYISFNLLDCNPKKHYLDKKIQLQMEDVLFNKFKNNASHYLDLLSFHELS